MKEKKTRSSVTGSKKKSTPDLSSPAGSRVFLRSANDQLPNTDLGSLLYRNSVRIRNLHFSMSVMAKQRLAWMERKNEQLRRKLIRCKFLIESLRHYFRTQLTPSEYAHQLTAAPISRTLSEEIAETRKQLTWLEKQTRFFHE